MTMNLPFVIRDRESQKHGKSNAEVMRFCGKYGVPVVARYLGVCKVNAAIAAQILIDSLEVISVINARTAKQEKEGILL